MYVRLEIAAQASMSCWNGALEGSVCQHAADILRHALTPGLAARRTRGAAKLHSMEQSRITTFFLGTVMFGAGRVYW